MSSNQKITTVRYCHIVQHNVILEYEGQNGKKAAGGRSFNCLNSEGCVKTGGCTNTLFLEK